MSIDSSLWLSSSKKGKSYRYKIILESRRKMKPVSLKTIFSKDTHLWKSLKSGTCPDCGSDTYYLKFMKNGRETGEKHWVCLGCPHYYD